MKAKLLWSAGILVTFLSLGSETFGQTCTNEVSTVQGEMVRPSLLEKVRAASLACMDDGLPVFFPVGSESRAREVRALMAEATAYLDRRLGVKADVTLAVLDRARWEALITWQPYGIPGVAGRPPVVFMPATDDGAATQDALAIEARVDPRVKHDLGKVGLTYEEAARRYVDLVALHELGHVYINRLGIWPNSRWLNELLATYVGYAYMRERRPESAALWTAMLNAYLSAIRPERSSLAEFDQKYFGVGPQMYVWYQAQFQQLVQRVYDIHGLAVLNAMREAFSTPSSEPLEPAAIANRLKPFFPGLADWMREVGQ
ncbi:MAG: hypothetical protein Q7U99_18855 [Rubrivivax sp.]|nr:hypothetical protein [Rubrivivax sp.]